MPDEYTCKNGIVVKKNSAIHKLELTFASKQVCFIYTESDREDVSITLPTTAIEACFYEALVEAAPRMFEHVHYRPSATAVPTPIFTSLPTPIPTHNETEGYNLDTSLLVGITKLIDGYDSY